MAAAALFYHYARSRQASTQAYTVLSVAVSVVYMLVPQAAEAGWVGLSVIQGMLFLVIKLREKQK